eukprot:1078502-Rhodomonas_salina.1
MRVFCTLRYHRPGMVRPHHCPGPSPPPPSSLPPHSLPSLLSNRPSPLRRGHQVEGDALGLHADRVDRGEDLFVKWVAPAGRSAAGTPGFRA